MNTKRTATPWQFSGMNSREIFDHKHCAPICVVSDRTSYDDADQANAEYIVLAVNHFDSLEKALRSLVDKDLTYREGQVCEGISEAEVYWAREALDAIDKERNSNVD